MNHQRKLIRKAVVELLAAGGTLAGSRVLDSQYKPRVQFPTLVVLVVGEDQKLLSDQGLGDFADRAVVRTMHLDVMAEVQKNDGAEDERDDLLAQCEVLLATAPQSIDAIKDIVPVAMRAEQFNEGAKPIDLGRQRFEITYLTTQGDPSAAV